MKQVRNQLTYSELRAKTHEEPNSFNPNLHIHHEVPGYKGMYLNQLHNNKILLLFCTIVTLFGIACVSGSIAHKSAVSKLNDELYQKQDIGLKMAVQYEDELNALKAENAALKEQIQLAQLSPKARTHMAKHPEVVAEIKKQYGAEWVAAVELYSRESSLDIFNINKSSGACGLWQAYPCEKLTNQCDLSDLVCQVRTGKEYVVNRYTTAQAALNSNVMRGWY